MKLFFNFRLAIEIDHSANMCGAWRHGGMGLARFSVGGTSC